MPTNEEKRLATMRDYSKRAYYRRKADRLCVHCAAPVHDGQVKCLACREYYRFRASVLANKRKNAELCRWCGMPAAGSSLCPECREKNRLRSEANRAKKAEVGE